jgi:hypothetical protein
VEVQLLLIHDLGIRWGEWSASSTVRTLPPGKGPPGTHCTGGWVGPRASMDTDDRGKIPSPLPVIEPRSLDRPTRNQTLYGLGYPAHRHIAVIQNFK